jgi:hypothetical protein
MAYFLNLFTPETWLAFRKHGATVSGFRERQLRIARDKIKPGDMLLCYLVRLSRWCGALEVKSPAFTESSPIFGDRIPSSSALKSILWLCWMLGTLCPCSMIEYGAVSKRPKELQKGPAAGEYVFEVH